MLTFFRRADIGFAPVRVNAARENVVDFTLPFFDMVGESIILKKVKQQSNLFQFLYVFDNTLWFCVLGIYFFASVLLWLFDRFAIQIIYQLLHSFL